MKNEDHHREYMKDNRKTQRRQQKTMDSGIVDSRRTEDSSKTGANKE